MSGPNGGTDPLVGSDPSATDPEPDLEVVLVAAVADNGVIGRDGGMPWRFPEDLRRFRETTTGHPVVMGRRTYESIAARLDGPLPDRTNVILTRDDPDLPGEVVRASSIEAALEAAAERDDVVYVVGGATVYEQFLPLADRLLLTEIHDDYEGDTCFPERNPEEWREVGREGRERFDFVEYVRR